MLCVARAIHYKDNSRLSEHDWETCAFPFGLRNAGVGGAQTVGNWEKLLEYDPFAVKWNDANVNCINDNINFSNS